MGTRERCRSGRVHGHLGAAALVLLLASCSGEAPSTLDPKGPGAASVEGLWWLMFWISTAVFAVVLGLILVSLRRRGQLGAPIALEEPAWGKPFVAVAGVILPWIILTSVFVVSLLSMRDLAAGGKDAVLTIEVVGHTWWWEVKYPNRAVTANEIHIPVGEPVRVKLTSADIIHSFWVPQLQVKVDQIPGRQNELWLQADSPGRYRGQCAEYCSLQHAHMIFWIVAEPATEFAAWMENEASPANEPDTLSGMRGKEVFLGSSCFGCHAVRGTEATASLGPDLTHLAARRTIGAGVLENTRENMALWITNPQRVKPGAIMPPTSLTPEELEALVDYLQQLR